MSSVLWLGWLPRAQADGLPPVVTIAYPDNGATVPAEGFAFRGTAIDVDGIRAVHIFVFDYARGSYTVLDAPADYDGGTQVWTFPVKPEHLTPGDRARLWVQAIDAVGNESPFQFHDVQVSQEVPGGPNTYGPSLVTIEGTRMLVAKRLPDKTLEEAKPLKLRGVGYMPVDPGETINSRADARRHLRESRYVEDFELLEGLGANAIKTYVDFGTDDVAIRILNEAYTRNLMVAVTLDVNAAEVEAVVSAYKNHPALLGWLIGNEWNLNRFYDEVRFPTIEAAAAAVEQTAQQILALDANHPVASSLGFLPEHYNLGPLLPSARAHPAFPTTFAEVLRLAPTVELWSFNVYRAGGFDPFFLEWRALSPGPFVFTEFGTDDWNQTLGRFDESAQADTALALWDEMHRHLSAIDASRQCVGGFVFAWNDEWWKAAGSPLVQDHGGFFVKKTFLDHRRGGPAAVFLGHPDGFSNEEHYGVVDMTRRKKQAFHDLQEKAFSLGWLRIDPVGLAATSQGGGPDAYALFVKRGLPFHLRYSTGASPTGGRGINVAIVDRSTGTVKAIRNFDTARRRPQAPCRSLLKFVNSLAPGDAALAAAAETACPNIPGGMGHASMAKCAKALHKLGSQRSLEIGFREAWALAAIVGVPPTNLAEDVGDSPDELVQISAEAFLDADRDGVTDNLDPDNDNDGVPDETERMNHTDILDPASR